MARVFLGTLDRSLIIVLEVSPRSSGSSTRSFFSDCRRCCRCCCRGAPGRRRNRAGREVTLLTLEPSDFRSTFRCSFHGGINDVSCRYSHDRFLGTCLPIKMEYLLAIPWTPNPDDPNNSRLRFRPGVLENTRWPSGPRRPMVESACEVRCFTASRAGGDGGRKPRAKMSVASDV